MLYKKLIIMLLAAISCNAMENIMELSGLIIETGDNIRVNIPQAFVQECSYLKDMLEDDTLANKVHETLKLKELNGEALKIAIKLVQLSRPPVGVEQDESLMEDTKRTKTDDLIAFHALLSNEYEIKVSYYLKKLTVPLLAHLLTTVNFLDCKILFKVVLLTLCKTIKETEYQAQQIHSSVYPFIATILEKTLPLDLQKIVQELLLIEFGLIDDFVTTSTPIKRVKGFIPEYCKYTYDNSKQSVVVSDVWDCMLAFDLSESPAKPLGAFNKADSFFSDDGKFLLIITEDQIVLINVTTHKQHVIPETDQNLFRLEFSDDSKYLFINDTVYDVETATIVTGPQTPLPKEYKESPQKENNSDWITRNNLTEYKKLLLKHPELKKLVGKPTIISILKHVQTKKTHCKIHVSDDANSMCVSQYKRKLAKKELYLIDISHPETINECIYLADIDNYSFTNSFLLVSGRIESLKTPDDKSYSQIGCFHFGTKKWTRYDSNNVSLMPHTAVFFGAADNLFIYREAKSAFEDYKFSWCYYLKTLDKLMKFSITLPKQFTCQLWEVIVFLDKNRVLINSDYESCVVTIPLNFLMDNYSLKELLLLIAHRKKTDVLSMIPKVKEAALKQ